MTEPLDDDRLGSIYESDQVEVTETGWNAAAFEDEQIQKDRREDQLKRIQYSDDLNRLLKCWALAVFSVCVATGLQAPKTEPTSPPLIAMMWWATCIFLALVASTRLRDWLAVYLKSSFSQIYGVFVALVFGWVIAVAECSRFAATWKWWTPLDLVFAFELPSSVLIALTGTVTAGAVAMFVVVLKHYFGNRTKQG